MNRRRFLAALGFGTIAAAAAATGAVDLERLLWLPSDKTIFLPSKLIWEPVAWSMTDPELGISIRFVRHWDKIDVLYGYSYPSLREASLRPELACRVIS